MNLTIDLHERYCGIAKTGAGKTELFKYLLRIAAEKVPVCIIDPKEQWLGDYPIWETDKRKPGTVDKPHLVDVFNPKFHVQVLQPDELGSGDERLEKFCFDLLKTRNRVIYFDETEGIATANMVPPGIRRIWKTGRSKGIAAWVATQTPSGIPKIFKSQADKFFTLQVGREDIELAAMIGHALKEEIADLRPYEFYFYDAKDPEMDTAEWNPPVPYKEKKAS